MKRYFPVLILLLLLSATGARANETISASGFVWNKPDITIVPGESVTWNWASGHTSTSTTGNNCIAGGPDPWNFTTPGMSKLFSTANDYNYMCSIHCGMGMKGIVRVVDFNLSCTPTTLTAAQGSTTNSSTCTITSLNGLILPVTLSTTGLPAGVTPGFTANPVTPPANGTIDSDLTLDVGGAVAPGSYPFTVTATATSGSTTPGVRIKTFNMTLNVTPGPDFTVNCSPSSWVMTADGSDTNTCTIASVGGFSDQVTLSCAGIPAGSTCGITPNPVTPPAGGNVTADVTIDAQGVAAPGTYNIQITGTGTPGTHSFDGTVVVQDFSVSASPTFLIAPPGGSAPTTATLTSLSGFNNAVDLACAGLPAGATCGFTPAQATPPPGGTVDSQVTVNVGSGVAENTYPFQITGTSGGLTRTTDLSILVTTAQDYSLGCTPSAPTGNRGGSTQSTCTITSINAYNGSVDLSCSSLPAGVTCDFVPNPANPPVGGSTDSVLTINIGAGVPIGSYLFHVDTTDGALSHSTDLTLTVAPLYVDLFEDGDVSDWIFKKGTWSSTLGALTGVSVKKGSAFAPYTMSTNSTVEADLKSAGGDNNLLSLYGWYMDTKNYVQLLMKQESGRWILKQKVNGDKTAKSKAVLAIDPNTTYHATLSYDGTQLHVLIDGIEVITVTAPPPPPGSPGFQIKATTGTFDEIFAYE